MAHRLLLAWAVLAAASTLSCETSAVDLMVRIEGTGGGKVTSVPGGVSCSRTDPQAPATGTCLDSFPPGVTVVLTPEPDLGSTFTGWSGSCSSDGSCEVLMSQPHTVTATFTADPRQLTVSVMGNGGGRVGSTPAGIDCGSVCSSHFTFGSAVTLAATADAGSVFAGWGDSCTGAGVCSVTMDQARNVTATFGVARRALAVTLAGAGSGAVTSDPAGIDCGVTCQAEFDFGTVVRLTATAAAGSAFAGWSGACAGIGVCVVTLDQVQNVTATFGVARRVLAVTLAGAGSGTVTSDPAGIDCGATCQAEFDFSTVVTLTPAAATGSVFAGWSGACTGAGVCVVTMDQAQNVTATFGVGRRALGVTLAGSGSGTVTSDPAGIDCGATCEAEFDFGTVVTLTATAAAGSVFVGWIGEGCTGTGTCVVTLSSASNVAASFGQLPPGQLALTVSGGGTGGGTLESDPSGIACSVLAGQTTGVCSATYDSGTVVTISAVVGLGSTFSGWSGPCAGTGTCVVTMDQAQNVTATFGVARRALAVTLAGAGSGTVTSDPAGIDCGATCQAEFDFGTVVTLTATAAAGSVFAGWSGEGCSGTGPCVVSLDEARTTTAAFDPLPAMRVHWVNSAGGNWSDGANWSTGVPPGPADTVGVAEAGTYTVVVDVDVSVAVLNVGAAAGVQTLSVAGATLTVSDRATFAGGATGVLALSAGALAGQGTVVVEGELVWTGGTMAGPGTTRIEPGGMLNMSGGTKTLSGGRVIENAGGAVWSAGQVSSGQGARFQVLEGGTFDVQADAEWRHDLGGEAPALENRGQLRRTAGSGLGTIAARITSTGTLEIGVGTLNFTAGGFWAGSGVLAAGATLNLGGGTHALQDGSNMTGDGTVQLTSGGGLEVAEGASAALARLLVAGGTRGAGPLNVGTLTSFGGTFAAGGITRATVLGLQGGTITLTGRHLIEIVQSGQWLAGPVNAGQGAEVHILAGASFNVGASHVAGTMDWLHALGGDSPILRNSGTMYLNEGKTLTVTGTFVHQAGALLSGTGAINLENATVGPFEGDINPGLPRGPLTIVGSFTQGPSSTLHIQLRRNVDPPDANDRLIVTGDVQLGGPLVVSGNVLNHVDGDRYDILTYSSRTGDFSSISLPAPGDSLYFSLDVGATEAQVAAVGSPAPFGIWTWVSGGSSVNEVGVFGTKGVADPSNVPSARRDGASWFDDAGNIWVMGGWVHDGLFLGAQEMDWHNDLWRYDGTNWTWMAGSSSRVATGIYGDQGVPDPANAPGARLGAASWTGPAGALSLFGGNGQGEAFALFGGELNDLWRFDGANWAWIAGGKGLDQAGNYGTKGVPDPANVPGARLEAATWSDADGAFWMFGGSGYDAAGLGGQLNDLWRLDGSTWTWVGGSSAANLAGVYGTMGEPDPSAMPGGRRGSAFWRDAAGTVWLFGGYGVDGSGTLGLLNDLWRLDGQTWTWVGGSATANQAGTYGVLRVAGADRWPGSRHNASAWVDQQGRLWLFGGSGYDKNNLNGFLNDLWRFDGTDWVWAGGSPRIQAAGVYGARGVADPANVPGAREGAAAVVDAAGNMWLFGGGRSLFQNSGDHFNDLWRFVLIN